MSDSVSRSDRLNAALTYFGILAVVGIIAAVFAVAYGRSGESVTPVNEDLRQARIALREKVAGEGRATLAASGKNADGTYRIPADKAVAVLIENPAAALAAARGVPASK